MKYTEFEFNKQDATYTRQIDTLKKLVECAENESSNLIDGVFYPVSTTWREIAQIALDLADGADWFDRYYKMNDSKKENNRIALLPNKKKDGE